LAAFKFQLTTSQGLVVGKLISYLDPCQQRPVCGTELLHLIRRGAHAELFELAGYRFPVFLGRLRQRLFTGLG
jgi:hypothetical protein